jgi:hypothetical protein
MDPVNGDFFPETFSGLDKGGSSNRTPFPSPFYDWTVSWMPRDIKNIFRWCEYLYKRNGIVRQATKRIALYPVTDIKFEEESTQVTDKYKDFLENTLKYKARAVMIGIDLMVYGNSILSVYLPFKRFLVCKTCKTEYPINTISWKFKDWKFTGPCKACGNGGEMDRIDRKAYDVSKVHLIRWDPKQIDIHYNDYSGVADYYYKVPPEHEQMIVEGVPHYLETIPWGIVESVKEKRKFKFNPDSLLHIKMPSLAGELKEWGLPMFVNLFQLHFHAAIARRANEGIFLDFAMPTRVIYPEQKTQNTEPVEFMNLGRFREEMVAMLSERRKDPLHVKISPVPIGYQTIGGEAKALNLFNEMKEINEEIMAAIGIPQDLFYGTMTIQAAPIALRLFENNWADYVAGLNEWIQWLCRKVGNYMDWEPVNLKFMSVRLIDDIEKKGMLFNLAASGKVSDLTALQSWGMDFKEEQRKFKEQQNITQAIQQEAKEEAKINESASEDGGGDGGGGGGAMAPGDIQAQADQIAQQLLQTPYEQRKSMLYNLQQQNETLYALASKKMEKMRNQAKTQQGQQQMQGGQGPGMPGPGVPGPQGPQVPGP